MLKILAVSLIAIGLSACVLANPNNVSEVSEKTMAEQNPHTGFTEFNGPVAFLSGNPMEGFYQLKGLRPSGGSGTESIYRIEFHVRAYNGGLRLKTAHSAGKELPLVRIDREKISCDSYQGCLVRETVGVDVTGEELESYAQSGLTLQLSGTRGRRVYTIPATYFAGYLQKVGQNRASG